MDEPTPVLVDRGAIEADLGAILQSDLFTRVMRSPQLTALDTMLGTLTGTGLRPRLWRLLSTLPAISDADLDALLAAAQDRATRYRAGRTEPADPAAVAAAGRAFVAHHEAIHAAAAAGAEVAPRRRGLFGR